MCLSKEKLGCRMTGSADRALPGSDSAGKRPTLSRRLVRSARYATPLTVAVLLFVASCASPPSLREQLEGVPAKHLSYYDFDPDTPVVDRIGPTPADLLDLYSEVDERELSSVELSAAQREELDDVLSRLPIRHQQVLADRLIGIYCIDNFAGSGMADWILGPGDEIYSVLVLHPRVFDMSAEELLTYRENTAFALSDSDLTVTVRLSPEVSALAYIVLHEATHIVDYAERHTPFVEHAMLELLGPTARDTPFTDEAWEDYSTASESADFSHRDDLRFYGLGGDPTLGPTGVLELYRELAERPFASLYASLSWAEDFAEFVTFHYLVHGLGAEYVIEVEDAGTTVFAYEPMSSPQVLRRRALIEPALLEAP